MKRIAVLAALIVLPCMPALSYAQADKPAAAASPPAPATKAAAAPAAKPAAAPAAKPVEKSAEKPARKLSRIRDTRDARGCLQLATNKEIIVCAQKYR